jgi:hypothetical protein
MDPKTALQKQLSRVICEAWIEYQLKPDFRKAWDRASYAWEARVENMKEKVIAFFEKETGAKSSAEYVAETLEHMSDRLFAESPDQETFMNDLGFQFSRLAFPPGPVSQLGNGGISA